MARNHYVSQLIIRRFSKAITTFDMEKNCVIENRQSHKVFVEKGIYDDDIEEKLAQGIEGPIARLLDNKIINNDDKITLTRRELFLLKKFLLLDSVRTPNPDYFKRLIEDNFSVNTRNYFLIAGDPVEYKAKSLPLTKSLNLSARDLHMRALRLFLDCDNEDDIVSHPLATQELYCWARFFYDSYINFWDSADNQEFLLSSTGMISDYEPSHSIFQGLDLSKFSYLSSKLRDNSFSETERLHCGSLLRFNTIMYENFNIFNLSATRCMVAVHPFFRLYNDTEIIVNDVSIKPATPDVWPTCFETRDIVSVPQNQYVVSPNLKPEKDVFEYKPVKLSLWDTIYLNSLIYYQTHKLLGINNIEKVADSLFFVNVANSVSDRELLNDLVGSDAMDRWIKNLLDDKAHCIFEHYKGMELNFTVNPFDMLDKYYQNSWQDIAKNKYVLKFLLSDEEKIKTMSNFAFLGSPDERVAIFKNLLKQLGE